MSLWQFTAAVGGYMKANAAGDEAITTEQAEHLADWIDQPAIWH